MNWSGLMVTELGRLKGAGMRSFDRAWEYALSACPPRQMELGPSQLQIGEEESLVDFLRRRCEMEWAGQVIDDFAGGLRALLEVDVEVWGGVVKRGTGSHSRPKVG